jgi:hypothetical protein
LRFIHYPSYHVFIAGGVAIPGASVGIFMGGFFLKRFQLGPKGALGLVISFNLFCLACYSLLFFVGCDNARMAGTTIPYYYNNGEDDPSVGIVNAATAATPSVSPSMMPLKGGGDVAAPRIFEVDLICLSSRFASFLLVLIVALFIYSPIKFSTRSKLRRRQRKLTISPSVVQKPTIARIEFIFLMQTF